jgi:hypothetical protein
MLLTLLALAASSYEPSCTSKSDPSLWWVFSGATGTTSATNDYSCKGMFFGSISCTTTVGLGRLYQTEVNPAGYPLYELRYLPYGDMLGILSFFQKPGMGVLFTPPSTPGLSPAATPPPPSREEYLRLHIEDRLKASAATQGITMHIWYCPEAPVGLPMERLEEIGMKVDPRLASVPVIEP